MTLSPRAALLAPLLLALAPPASPRLDVRATSSSAIPSSAQSALALAARTGRDVQTMAFTPDGEFVVVTANRALASPGFPAAVKADIERYAASGREIDVVAFSRTGQWLVIAEDWLRRSNVPDAATTRIRALQSQRVRVTSFAFSPVDANGWVLTAGGRAYAGGRLPTGLQAALDAAAASDRPVHEVAIAPTGQWVLVAGSWFASRGLPADLRATLEEWRTDDRRRLDHVVLTRVGTTLGWSVISNAAEPAGGDALSRIENGLTAANASIYQRMKAHRITGLSIAVVEGDRITQRSYGLRLATQPESYVYPNTIFEAASISKPLSAVGALQLADRGVVGLHDTTVLATVAQRVLLPAHVTYPARFLAQFDDAGAIDLNRLLSHCAGVLYERQLDAMTRTGAESFALSASAASLAQSLVGQSPSAAGYRPVQRSRTLDPGVRFQYSGATYLVAQAVIEAYATGGYDAHMTRLLGDLGMTSSTFRTPAPARLTSRFARGHVRHRPTDVRTYPAQAAASLSTTADDLARFVIMLNGMGRSATGRQVLGGGHVRALARLQAGTNDRCASRGSMGLGLYRTNGGTWWHRGRHGGYLAYIHARPGASPWGLAMLITGDEARGSDAPNFAAELLASVESAFGLSAGTLPR